MNSNIENLTPDIGSFEIKDNIIYYDLGSMLRNSSKKFSLEFLNKTHSSIRVGCGACTTTKLNQKENSLELDITYRAIDSRGIITKTVTETFTDSTSQIIKFTVKII